MHTQNASDGYVFPRKGLNFENKEVHQCFEILRKKDGNNVCQIWTYFEDIEDMLDTLANNAIKELEKDLSVLVEGIEARETEGQETEIEERGQPSMDPMDVPPAIEAAELFSKIEELTNSLGLHIALGHLFKTKKWLLRANVRRPKKRKTDFWGFYRHFVELHAR